MKRKMKREEIIRGIRAARALPPDKHLTSLPCKRPFLYGRVSGLEQVRESESERLNSLLRRRKHGKTGDNEIT